MYYHMYIETLRILLLSKAWKRSSSLAFFEGSIDFGIWFLSVVTTILDIFRLIPSRELTYSLPMALLIDSMIFLFPSGGIWRVVIFVQQFRLVESLESSSSKWYTQLSPIPKSQAPPNRCGRHGQRGRDVGQWQPGWWREGGALSQVEAVAPPEATAGSPQHWCFGLMVLLFQKYFQVNQKPLGWLWEVFRVSGIFLKEPAEGWFQKVFFLVKGCSLGIGFFGQVVLETKENTFSFNMILKGSRLYFLMQIDSIHPSHQHEPPKSRFFLILPWHPQDHASIFVFEMMAKTHRLFISENNRICHHIELVQTFDSVKWWSLTKDGLLFHAQGICTQTSWGRGASPCVKSWRARSAPRAWGPTTRAGSA